MITVFTPAYNRKKTLKKLYESLLTQINIDFEWLIIDDGSSDGTKEYIEELKKINKIKIRYYYQENSGKMSAVNKAHELAKGKYFITVDSDDYLVENVLKNVLEDIKKIDNEKNVAGLVYNCAYQTNKNNIVAKNMPNDGTKCTYFELSSKYKVVGDKAAVWKTCILRDYKFPIIKGEKFVPDAYLMNEISKKYTIIVNNRIVTLINYCEDGLTNNYFNLVRKNPNGNRLYYLQLYDFEKSLYNVYGYLLFSIYAKIKLNKIIKEHPGKFYCLLLYLPTLIVSKLKN